MSKINIIKVSNTEAQEKEVYSRKETDLKFGTFKAESIKYMYNHYVRNPNEVPFWHPPRTGTPLPWDYNTIDAASYRPTRGLNFNEVGKIAEGIYSYTGTTTAEAFITGVTGTCQYSVIAGKGNYITLANTKVPRAFLYHWGENKDVAIDTYGTYNKLNRVPNGATLFVGVPGREQYNIDLPLTLSTPLDYYEKQVITMDDFVAQLRGIGLGSAPAPQVDHNTVKYITVNDVQTIDSEQIRAQRVETRALKVQFKINIQNQEEIGLTNRDYNWRDSAELLVAFKDKAGYKYRDNINKDAFVYRMTFKQMLEYIVDLLSSPVINLDITRRNSLHSGLQDLLKYNPLILGELRHEGIETYKAYFYNPQPTETEVTLTLTNGNVHDVRLLGNAMLKIKRNENNTFNNNGYAHTTGIIKITGANNITGYSSNCVWGEVPKDLKGTEIFTYYCDTREDKIYLARM